MAMRVTHPRTEYREAVAGAVRAEMARNGTSQQTLANAIGCSQQFLSRRVTGRVAFDVDELADVAAALGVPVTSLLPADAPARAA